MLHHPTMGDGVERADGCDTGEIEHVAGLEAGAAFRRDLGGVGARLVDNTRIEVDADDTVAEGG